MYKKGQRVTYAPTGERGIVKKDKQMGQPLVFVVFKRDNNWDHFEDSTGQACNHIDLKQGWD